MCLLNLLTFEAVMNLIWLLIGCKKKLEIMQHFQVSLGGMKGLCGKICDFILANYTKFCLV